MKQVMTIFILFFFNSSINAQQAIEGIWNTGQDNTQIEIKAVGNQYEGTILFSDNPKVPIEKLMIKEAIKDGDVYKGKLYAIRKKKWVNAVFAPDRETLVVTITAGWKKKIVEWEKVN